jgi:hypothetical protein
MIGVIYEGVLSASERHNVEVWQHRAVDALMLIVSLLSLLAVIVIGCITYGIMVRGYWDRRITAVLDTLLEMRDEYSKQYVANHGRHPTPNPGSVEKVRRQDLRRTLAGQVSVFDDDLASKTAIHCLATKDPEPWGMDLLDTAIRSATDLLRDQAPRFLHR